VICANQISGWCTCHIRIDTTLESMGIVNEKLVDFVNKLQAIYGIIIPSEIFTSWKILIDVSNYLASAVQ